VTPDEFKTLYVGEFKPHLFEKLSSLELLRIEKDKFYPREDRRLARKIRTERHRD
jgi:hypothetical protein